MLETHCLGSTLASIHTYIYLVAFGPSRHRAWVLGQRALQCSLGSPGRPLGCLKWYFRGLLGAVSGPLGACFGPLLGLLGPAWGLLGASWGLLGPSWGLLEASWAVLGASWDVLGPSWAPLGTSWWCVRRLLATCCGPRAKILIFHWFYKGLACQVEWRHRQQLPEPKPRRG